MDSIMNSLHKLFELGNFRCYFSSNVRCTWQLQVVILWGKMLVKGLGGI